MAYFASHPLVWAVLLGFGVSTLVAWLLVHTRHWHLHLTGDHPEAGPQKLHTQPTPRIGGLAILLGLVAGLLALRLLGPGQWRGLQVLQPGWILFSLVPLFALGLLEDIFKAISIRLRLLVSFGAGALLWWLADVRVVALDVPLLDDALLHWPALSLLFTVFAVGGLVHATNIIDGLNGLLAGVALVIFAAVGVLAYRLGDPPLVALALLGAAAVAGFAVLNFPGGKLFCGDAGAYLVGFWVATLVILVVVRHPAVSPWFALAVVMHPVTETLYSAWRRARQGLSATEPDARHMHSLWAAWLQNRQRLGGPLPLLGANAGGAWRTALVAAVPSVLAVSSAVNVLGLLAICMAYVGLFVWLVRWLQRPWAIPPERSANRPNLSTADALPPTVPHVGRRQGPVGQIGSVHLRDPS